MDQRRRGAAEADVTETLGPRGFVGIGVVAGFLLSIPFWWMVPSHSEAGAAPARLAVVRPPIAHPGTSATPPVGTPTTGTPPSSGPGNGEPAGHSRDVPLASSRSADSQPATANASSYHPPAASHPTYTPSYSDDAGSGEETVHVRGYYRKNGTYVSPHSRRAPRHR